MDFSKAENIIFVAAMGVVTLAMLAFLLTLIIKGKRKTCALDIVLRIFCVIVLIAALALSALAVFTMLTGDFRIEAKDGAALLFAGENVIELPMPVLFEILSDLVGAILCFAPALLALIVLIVDCALARKNYEPENKPKKAPVDNRTPEEKKRAAEIERIRRLANSAVKKTSTAASAETVKATEKPDAEKQSDTAKEEDTENTDTLSLSEPEEDFDWRVDPAPSKKEFVGISETNTDDSFDSFDSFDDTADSDETGSDTAEEDYTDTDGGDFDTVADEGDFDTVSDDGDFDALGDDAELEQNEEDGGAFVPNDSGGITEDEVNDAEQSDDASDEPIGDEEDFELNRDIYIPEIRTITKTRREFAPVEPEIKRPKKHAYVDNSYRYLQDRNAYEPDDEAEPPVDTVKPAETVKPVEKKGDDRKTSPDQSAKEAHAEIVKKKIAQVRKAHEKSAAKRREAEANAEKEAETLQPIKRPTKRPASAQPVKPAAPQSNKPTKSSGKNGKRDEAAQIDSSKKLPVTRRYVIMDRTSAVNIFNDYLKERDRAEKDKLESMVSTIILK